MTLEKKLINKSYYEGLTMDREEPPIEVLGQLYIAEQRKNVPDLTSIRFAQGELYFLVHDYESAIFKWENIANELEPWAKKNLADAYMELGELSTAESIYKAVLSDSELLNTEISMQLFALYIEKGNHDMAQHTIKSLLATNPDYANMTMLAKAYFEENENWEDAIELAVNEGERTNSLKWYEALVQYAKIGVIAEHEPGYFMESIRSVSELDQRLFEKLSTAIWANYENSPFYLAWLRDFNQLFQQLHWEEVEEWKELPEVLENAYLHLISSAYPIKEIRGLVPAILSNLLVTATNNRLITAASAVLAWNEMFPGTLATDIISTSEHLINNAEAAVDLTEIMQLLESISNWAQNNDIIIDKKFSQKVVEQIPSESHQLLIIGSPGSGVNSCINELVGETLLSEDTNSLISIQDQDYLEMAEVTEEGARPIDTLSDFYEEQLSHARYGEDTRIFHLYAPSAFLHENNWAITTLPFPHQEKYADYALLADSLLFVINERSLFQSSDYERLLDWKEKAPHLTIQFLIYADEAENEKVATKRLQKATVAIDQYFPNSAVFLYSKENDRSIQLNDISSFYRRHFAERNLAEERTVKSIAIVQDLLSSLFEKRLEMEESLYTTLRMYEEIVSKLSGANNQLSDIEVEKTRTIVNSFEDIKDTTTREIMTEIPKILRDCKDFVKEDSDFGKIHIELNDKMNSEIDQYVHKTLLPKVYDRINEWIRLSQEQLNESQHFLNELCEGFNGLYEEDQLTLQCDFSILDDWKRDARRLTNSIKIDKANILLRLKPSQVLLKSAGKLFGSIPQNKKMLHTRYHKYLETEDFTEVAQNIVDAFLLQFDFYENGLAGDIHIFFSNPYDVLQKTIEDKNVEIHEYQELLERLKNNPEMFHDPLRLFELRLLQYDWLTSPGKLSYSKH